MYVWNWNIIWQYKDVFIQGALVTIWLTLFAIILGTIVGTLIAWSRRSQNGVVSWLAKVYIEIFRAVPILVLLIWIFYVLPILIDFRLSPFFAAGLALALHLAAFVAETVRAGIEAVPKGQYEAGIALGMTNQQIMRRIVLPQALRNMIPNLMGLYINELKNSSLASIIAVNEVLHRSNILISNTFRPLEIYTTVAAVYLIIILPLTWLSRMVERRLSKSEKSNSSIEYEHA